MTDPPATPEPASEVGDQPLGADDRPRLGRLSGLSDGVFAIAATLLVLELRAPRVTGDGLLAAVLRQWPQLIAFAGAFLAIGGSWLGHRLIVAGLGRDTHAVHVVNLVLLMLVSFVPFPALLVADFLGTPQEQQAVALLASALAAVGLALVALDRTGRTTHRPGHRARRPRRPTSGEVAPLAYAVAAGVSLADATAGLLLVLAISGAYITVPRQLAALLS